MKSMKYEKSRFDVDPGMYRVEFVGVDEKEFAQSNYGPGGLKYLWKFKVMDGPKAGTVIEQITGSDLVPKSKCLGIVTMLLGRGLNLGEEVNPAVWVGKRYNLAWSVNPDSEQGRCHVASLSEIFDAAPGAGAPPPPPPPGRGSLFWVILDDNSSPVQRTIDAIREHIGKKQLDPEKVMVCPVGSQTWQTASSVGVEDGIPF